MIPDLRTFAGHKQCFRLWSVESKADIFGKGIPERVNRSKPSLAGDVEIHVKLLEDNVEI